MMNLMYCVKESEGIVKASMPGKSIVAYRFDFSKLAELRNSSEVVKNNFISYILRKKVFGQDRLYVGMSTNGIKNRPFEHFDLEYEWDECYVVTDEAEESYWDKAVAEHAENYLRSVVDNSHRYLNYTKHTSRRTLPDHMRVICDEAMRDATGMLQTIGLNLDDSKAPDRNLLLSHVDEFKEYPDGIPCYYNDRVKDSIVVGIYLPNERRGSNFLLFKGSTVCDDGKWAPVAKEESRYDYPFYLGLQIHGTLVDDVLVKTIKTSISRAKSLASGSSCDSPYRYFTCLNGRTLADELFYRALKAEEVKDDDRDTDW